MFYTAGVIVKWAKLLPIATARMSATDATFHEEASKCLLARHDLLSVKAFPTLRPAGELEVPPARDEIRVVAAGRRVDDYSKRIRHSACCLVYRHLLRSRDLNLPWSGHFAGDVGKDTLALSLNSQLNRIGALRRREGTNRFLTTCEIVRCGMLH